MISLEDWKKSNLIFTRFEIYNTLPIHLYSKKRYMARLNTNIKFFTRLKIYITLPVHLYGSEIWMISKETCLDWKQMKFLRGHQDNTN